MIYLLYGEDDYSRSQALASIKAGVVPADLRDVNITELDGSEVSLEELVATCGTVPFLAEKRVVVVRGLLSLFERRTRSRRQATGSSEQAPSRARWRKLPEHLPRLPESTDLVFVDGRLTGINSLLAAVRPLAAVRSFQPKSPGEVRRWIRERAAAEEMEVQPGAVDALADTVGNDLWALAAEMEKLYLYRRGAPVRREDVEELVSYAVEANIFATVDAVLEGRPDTAFPHAPSH